MNIPQPPGTPDPRATDSLDACPVCSSQRITFLLWGKSRYEGTWFRYDLCDDCEAIFVNPRIPEVNLTEALGGRQHSYVKYLPTREYDRYEADLNLVGPTLKLHRGNPSNLRWLDIGCGIGNLLEAAKSRGCKCYGLDADASLIGWAKENTTGTQFATATLDALPFDPPFDIISADNVLEHINNPQPFLMSIHEILAQDGLLVIRVPNYNSLPRHLISLVGRLPTSFVIDPDAHPLNYSASPLRKLFEETGFEPIRIMEHLMVSYGARRIFNHLNPKWSIPTQRGAAKILRGIGWIDRLIPKGGLNVTVFARVRRDDRR
ncbi:MAG: class I SAM-dependent methyltransferase [Candidatus Omnitrophica bacterium]|nr:class I SAM-dependent methyltransferase [Candidatus Omnitrophota bacterium]MCB9766625.1 class I SAM-dependent methyltransferase [Candidatus Omnitrophota bacterium]